MVALWEREQEHRADDHARWYLEHKHRLAKTAYEEKKLANEQARWVLEHESRQARVRWEQREAEESRRAKFLQEERQRQRETEERIEMARIRLQEKIADHEHALLVEVMKMGTHGGKS